MSQPLAPSSPLLRLGSLLIFVLSLPTIGRAETPAPQPAPTSATQPAPASATQPAPASATQPAPASATQPAPASATQPTAQKTATAQALVLRARAAYRAGDFSKTVDLFRQAYALESLPKYLYNMARAEEKQAHFERAIALLQRYIDTFRLQNNRTDPPNLAEVQSLIRALGQRAYQTLPTVLIQSRPPNAIVTLVAKSLTLGSTPLTTHLKPGAHKLKLELPDHAVLNATVQVPQTGEVNVLFSLKARERRAALAVWCNVRQVQIALDGKVVAMTPLRGRLQIAPGRHQLSLSRQGYTMIQEHIDVPEGKELQVSYQMHPTETPLSWRSGLGWPVLLAGLGGIGAGIGSMTQAENFYTNSPDFLYWERYQNLGYRVGGPILGLGLGLVIWDAVRENIAKEELVQEQRLQPGHRLVPLTKAKIDGAGGDR